MATRVSAVNSPNAYWQDYEIQGVRKDHVNSVTHGVISLSDLTVTESDTPANTIKVDTGDAYINVTRTSDSANFTVKFTNSSAEDLAITSNVSGDPRIDLVVARVDIDTEANANADNIGILEVIEGTPAGSPVAPSAPANSIPLATISVANGQTTFLNADVTDGRQLYHYHSMRVETGASGKSAVNHEDYSSDASAGITSLSVAPASASNPIAVGDNDTRMLSTSEKDSLVASLDASPLTDYAVASAISDSNVYTAPDSLRWVSVTTNYVTSSTSGSSVYSAGSNEGTTNVLARNGGTQDSDTDGTNDFIYHIGRITTTNTAAAMDTIDVEVSAYALSNSSSESRFGCSAYVWNNSTSKWDIIGENTSGGLKDMWSFGLNPDDYVNGSKYVYILLKSHYVDAGGSNQRMSTDFMRVTENVNGTIATPKLVYFDNTENAVRIFDGDNYSGTEDSNIKGFALAGANAPFTAARFDSADANEYYSKATTDDIPSLGTDPATLIPTFAGTNEANLNMEDGVYTTRSASNSGEYCYQMFELDSAGITVADLIKLDVMHKGYADGTNLTAGHEVYIWNETDTQWELISSTAANDATTSRKSYFSSESVAKYINGSNKLYILARSNSTSDGIDTMILSSDYVEVTYFHKVTVQSGGVLGGFTGLNPGLTHFPAKENTVSDYEQITSTQNGTLQTTTGNYYYVSLITDNNFGGFVKSLKVNFTASGTNALVSIHSSSSDPSGSNDSFGAPILTWDNLTNGDNELIVDQWLHGRLYLVIKSDSGTSTTVTRTTDITGWRKRNGINWESGSYAAWCKLDVAEKVSNKSKGDVTPVLYQTRLNPVGRAISETELLIDRNPQGRFEDTTDYDLLHVQNRTVNNTCHRIWTGFTPVTIMSTQRYDDNQTNEDVRNYYEVGVNNTGGWYSRVDEAGFTTGNVQQGESGGLVSWYIHPHGVNFSGSRSNSAFTLEVKRMTIYPTLK